MSTDLAFAFLGFAFVSLVTPGPNNLMLMASGANYGLRRSLPHMLGVALGFGAMVGLVGVGLMALFARLPALELALKLGSMAFLAWLAWKIAHAAAPGSGAARGTPLTFAQAAAFQWVNPKGWAMALTAVSAYAPEHSWTTIGLLAGTFATIGIGSSALWTTLGTRIRRLLTSPRRLRAFNWTMAGLLVATLIPVLLTPHGAAG
jgi:threonine/homoserine/homoserine lactone efflux protein